MFDNKFKKFYSLQHQELSLYFLKKKKKKKKNYFSTQPDPMLQANWSLQQNNYWWNEEDIGGRNGKLIDT